jgi:hypothetical protein
MAIKFNIENNELDNNSFALLRTNPKFTSNIKLVVDSSEDIFLSSFKANNTLSKVKFQKFKIKKNGQYSNDVAQFFKGLTVNEIFEVLRKNSDITPYSEYSYQYENQYNYGASFNSTKLYDEQYKMFAPIWLDRKIPRKFVIYRVLDVDYKTKYDETTEGQNNRILNLLKDATIIKTFDLTRNSSAGQYLHNHVFNKAIPTSSLNFNFGEEGEILYNGIDTSKGGFASKLGLINSEYLKEQTPEIYANELITSGFEDNGLISANLINMEFMFDDNHAENYEIYRYFGLYVDDIEEGTFKIDTISLSNIISVKPNSVETTYNLENTALSPDDFIPNTGDLSMPTLNYIKYGYKDYMHVRNLNSSKDLRIPISRNSDDIKIIEYTKSSNKVKAVDKSISNKGFISFKITGTPNHNDRLFIGDKTELKIENYSLYDFTLIADENLDAGISVDNRFSTKGGAKLVAMAIGRVINKKSKIFKVSVDKDTVTIEEYANGDNRERLAFGIYNQNLNQFINVIQGKSGDLGLSNTLVNNPPIDTDFNDWDMYTSVGGSKKGAAFFVDKSELGDIKVNQYFKFSNLNKYVRVTEIVNDYSDSNLYRVILENSISIPSDGDIQLYDKFRPSFGKFSAYDLKDFDFDFHSTRYSDLGELIYENDFKKFNNPLTPILKQEEIDNVEQDSSNIRSEYDRLSENKLKETALLSRIVPTFMKFKLKDSTNARNKPYILNASEAFGTDNLSPNIKIESGRSIDNLNMEHFHINKIPEEFLINNTLTGLNSYLDFKTDSVGLSLEKLKSTDVDYFSLYFKWNGYKDLSDVWIDDKFKNLFTKFRDGSGELNSSTVFRGLRYLYKNRKETEKTAPTEFIETSEVNDFKFGVVLTYKSDDDTDSNKVNYSVVKNDTFKFICVFIELNIVSNDVSYITRDILYNKSDITKGVDVNGIPIPVDSTIPFNLDLTRTDWNTPAESYSVFSSIFDELNGNAQFTQHITTDNENNYSWIYFTANSGDYCMKVLSVISDSEILVDGIPIPFINGAPEENPNVPVISDADIAALPSNTEFKYWRTGVSGWKNVLEEIVSYKFAQRFNKFGDITYITVNKDNVSYNDFVLEVQDGVEFLKPSILTNSSDGDRPKSYQLFSGEIGKVISGREDGGYFTILRRMNGGYDPLFKDCISFTDINTEQSLFIPELGETTIVPLDDRANLIYNKFRYLGVAFASYKNVDSSYGFINNMYFHKVNDENFKNLLRLSETSDKLPLYPVIGEIAIDKKDFNVFKSKYASDYFTKSLPGLNREKAHGTLTPVELKSFMVSTIMKVKDNYDLTKFSSIEETSLDALDRIRFNKLDTESIHWFESEEDIVADFYLPRSIFSELLEDGIYSKFKKYVDAENSFGDKSTVKDDLEKYVYNNIVNRFIIESIDVYGIEGKDLETSFVSVNQVEELKENNFKIDTGFEIQGYQKDGLSFRLIYNKKIGYKYNLKLHIKIQA